MMEDHTARMSDSPRRSPRITQALNSPTRSIHPEMIMGSLNSQSDFGHRTADFFDDTSDSDPELGDLAEQNILEQDHELPIRRATPPKDRKSASYLGGATDRFHSRCEEKRASSPTAIDAYLRLTPHAPHEGGQPGNKSADSSLAGSVQEMTPSRPRRSSERKPRRDPGRPSRSPPSTIATDQDDESPIIPKQNKADQILGAHAITLQALLRTDEALDPGAPSLPPPKTAYRATKFLESSLRNSRRRSASAPIKKVSVVPPPIDTSIPRRLDPEDIVRTPYPYPFPGTDRKDFGPSPTSNPTATPMAATLPLNDSILTLSVRRLNRNSRPRISTISIPANPDFAARNSRLNLRTANSYEKDAHFRGLDFDDAVFFVQLREQYNTLLGAQRFFSARSLTRITVSGFASREADARYGWLATPRSPRAVAYRGLSDTFSEERLMKQYTNPRQGKARYAWVSWAHRLAAAPTTPVPLSARTPASLRSGADAERAMVKRLEQPEGLEFVVSWSVRRILSVLILVLLLSLAAALLWVFLGRSSMMEGVTFRGPVMSTGGGLIDAGDRVGTGIIMGICVLLLGLTGMGGWIGVSWLLL